MKKQDIKHLLEQHNSDYSNIQQQMFKLKKEDMVLAKKNLNLKKAHQENIELLTSLIKKVNELTNIIQSIAPQYLE
ncbi:unnamed protein product [Lasius platythorax]|uniref:Uncharacterized protein n=1 Tax=Lasius platythorax TaxID=488582 RepID=A0AAV2MWI2_9HYME